MSMVRRASARFPSIVLLGSGALVFAACASDAPGEPAPIDLHLIAPKTLIEKVDQVRLVVFERALIDCKGIATSGLPDESKAVFKLDLGTTGCPSGKKWCATGEIPKDPAKVLTFYVVGRKGGGLPVFEGCRELAVDQSPLTVDITVVPHVEGAKCGDGALAPPETCDPAGGSSDEACDGKKCQTKEVILSNGTATDRFFSGNPGRKTGVRFLWQSDGGLDGNFFAAWADGATGGSGADGYDEITVRRLTAELVTDSSSTALSTELRLQTTSFSPGGGKKRGGSGATPTLVPIEGGNLLAVFALTPPDSGSRSHVYVAPIRTNLGAAMSADLAFDGTAEQLDPAAAGDGTGNVLVAFLEGGAVKSQLRKAGAGAGTLSAPQAISTGGTTNTSPRVAWVGSDFVVAWSDGDDIKMRRVGVDGAPKGGELVVNASRKPGKQDEPAIAGFADGTFMVAFRSSGGEGDTGADIRIQKFDKAGNPTGSEIGVPLNAPNAAGDQGAPAVASGKTPGGQRYYVVAWTDPDRQQIGARFVNADADGYLLSYPGGNKDPFDVGVGARPRSSPAVAAGQGFCAVGWADDSAGDAGGDDDRVRVRRLPLPWVP